MQDTAYKHTGLTGVTDFVCKNFAKLAVLPKNAAKVTLLCQIGTYQIAHNSF